MNDLVTNGLTNDEIRHLIQRLKLEEDRFLKDICGGLPVEILLQIAQFLDVEELIRARRVSRTWNEKFSNPDFCIGVVKIHFRGIWESDYNKSLTGADEEAEKLRLAKWLSGACKQRMRRNLGLYIHMETFSPLTMEHNDETSDHMPQYCNRRVAFKDVDEICVKWLDVSFVSVYEFLWLKL